MRRRPLDPRQPDAWQPYEPDGSRGWGIAEVAHLHRRAGFLATWETLQRDLAEGPAAAVGRLLEGEPRSLDGQSASAFESDQDALARQAAASGQLALAQAAWLHRMIHTPHPLRERMTLFWHNHFATSQAKVNNLALMVRQNATLRAHALERFGPMLKAIGRDPAMLIWLDATVSRKSRPNENYAREVMELFTLGRGHYSERDIREAARAFTGRFVEGDLCREVESQHDSGEKTILGRTGRFDGDDVADLLLEQPACGRFLARKLAAFFLDETREWEDESVGPLAERLRATDYDIGDAVGLILRSRLFYEPALRRRRVKSPVELTVGAVRALEVVRPTVSTRALAAACERMGQSLYQPPNVAGWPGGSAWLTTTALVARANFAAALIHGGDGLGPGQDIDGLARRHGSSSPGERQRFLNLLLLGEPSPAAGSADDAKAEAVALLSSPEFQVA
ncbi:MAG: hypothetical protein KatS3mg108_1543 [Isosphaeraceae bacterium]|jgi:uncharacterized protein (DUF1800 family)|nr:MAG: hypothetical protein KatS3mg108_1543 [Isosphaeraceae bacterium]